MSAIFAHERVRPTGQKKGWIHNHSQRQCCQPLVWSHSPAQ